MINVLKKVAPAIPQLRAADAANMPATTCPLRLAKAYVPATEAPAMAMEENRCEYGASVPYDKKDERA